MNTEESDYKSKLIELFGSYRAEWLDDRIFDLFTEPSYFPELVTTRPCILIGGRGTGKTTVLKILTYEGQYALAGKVSDGLSWLPFIGIFYRIETNKVSAFKGDEVSQGNWQKYFSHYINLILSFQLCEFICWCERLSGSASLLCPASWEIICRSLRLNSVKNGSELALAVRERLIEFEASINNIADERPKDITLLGAPLDVIVEEISKAPLLSGKKIFFLLDEYENLEDYQQQIVNTLLKHSGVRYSFKIGVRELGWRQRNTLNTNEQLISPQDYVRINVTERLGDGLFEEFAKKVCDARISKVAGRPMDIEKLLPGLSEETEAELLYSSEGDRVRPVSSLNSGLGLSSLERLFLEQWCRHSGDDLEHAVKAYSNGSREWVERYENYKYSYLFLIRKGRSGIRKYYCGWSVYTRLAAGNIRFLLELVDRALLKHLESDQNWESAVSYQNQTLSAQEVGRKNLSELEGVDVEGARLTKLLLGLGRVFQVMAAEPVGHTPEVNQFSISNPSDVSVDSRVQQLIALAVRHLAIIRLPGSKASDPGDTKDWDYMIHPVFSAYFVYSHRRKRKLELQPADLLNLIESPKAAINQILERSDRSAEVSLPEQMTLFTAFLNG